MAIPAWRAIASTSRSSSGVSVWPARVQTTANPPTISPCTTIGTTSRDRCGSRASNGWAVRGSAGLSATNTGRPERIASLTSGPSSDRAVPVRAPARSGGTW